MTIVEATRLALREDGYVVLLKDVKLRPMKPRYGEGFAYCEPDGTEKGPVVFTGAALMEDCYIVTDRNGHII